MCCKFSQILNYQWNKLTTFLITELVNSLLLQFLLFPCIASCMHSLLHLHVRTQNSNDLENFNTRKGKITLDLLDYTATRNR